MPRILQGMKDRATAVGSDEHTGPIVRRAPFSDNPTVGARGRQTRQRILDASLVVLGADGFHRCSVENVAKEAGCSRATFYQYFESKEEVFTRLAMQVTQYLEQATDELGPVTPDPRGWEVLRNWSTRFAATYDAQRPVFHNFAAASQSDPHLARRLAREGRRYHAVVLYRLQASDLEPNTLAAVVDIMASTIFRALDDTWMLDRSTSDTYRVDEVLDAYTDVYHRTLFGPIEGVNVHGCRPLPPAELHVPRRDGGAVDRTNGDATTRVRLLQAGRAVFGRSGYHGASIDDIVTEAGVSHGSFYSYFPSKERLAEDLALEAAWQLSAALAELEQEPGPADRGSAELHDWLDRYTRAQASATAVLRAWFDAALVEEHLLTGSGPLLEFGRRRLARFLDRRGFPGTDTDALVLLALLDSLGVAARSERTLHASTRIIERGFLGR